jgi:uncharacterized protein YcbX
MHLGTVADLWRYPAKSMQGERLPVTEVVPVHGIVGDRAWAVRDEVRGGIRGAKKIAGLMQLAAAFEVAPTPGSPSRPIRVSLPDGSTVRSDDPGVDARLSTALGHPVTLHPLHPAEDLDHYRRGGPDHEDVLEELQDIFGREPDEPLPDLSLFPPEVLEFESPPGTYFDAYPLLLLTDRSLATLAERAPGSEVDVRRFRPNVVVAVPDGAPGADDPWPEQAWVGRSLRLGDVVVDVVGPCPRCVMITRAVAELPADRSLMRTVVREADQNLGVYATVRTGGTLRAGAAVTPAD